MSRRLVSLWAVAAVSGCWAEERLIHGAFTAEQWAALQEQYAPLGASKPCDLFPAAHDLPIKSCDAVAKLGQMLFFEPALSGPWLVAGANRYPAAQTSCATCHDAVSNKATGWYIDTRADNAVSQGAEKPTPHNTITLVNISVGDREIFTWAGQCKDKPCQTTIDVMHDIALPKAMASDPEIIGRAMRWLPGYLPWYRAAFGDSAPIDDISLQSNVEVALDAYMRRLVSLDAPFDAFIGGDANAIDDAAKRGFALFVGRAMCAECHRGSLFSDEAPRVTGVLDEKLDTGHQGTGGFFTPGLRNVVHTAPYMHNGSLETISDVLWFYRQGGESTTYHGDKDPLMRPLDDLSDDDVKDLEAFLHTLTGKNIPSELRADTHLKTAPMTCTYWNGNPGLVCGGVCRDVLNDIDHCGACGNTCMGYCMGGSCGP